MSAGKISLELQQTYAFSQMVIDNFENFNIEEVYKKGVVMYTDGKVQDFEAPVIAPYLDEIAHDTFHVPQLSAKDFAEKRPRAVLGMIPGEIVTEDRGYADHIDVEKDILKIAVIERHKNTRHIGIGYINGYGLKSGAVATSISHDSHNIIAVGTNEEDIALAVNRVIDNKGGIVVVDNGVITGELVLSIAGIMSEDTLEKVNQDLEDAKEAAFKLGVNRGVIDVITQQYV